MKRIGNKFYSDNELATEILLKENILNGEEIVTNNQLPLVYRAYIQWDFTTPVEIIFENTLNVTLTQNVPNSYGFSPTITEQVLEFGMFLNFDKTFINISVVGIDIMGAVELFTDVPGPPPSPPPPQYLIVKQTSFSGGFSPYYLEIIKYP